MIYQESAELKYRADLAQAQAQAAAYAQHILNVQLSALCQGTPMPTSEVAAEARQGLVLEGTARRVDAP
jgi:hypothetical protein